MARKTTGALHKGKRPRLTLIDQPNPAPLVALVAALPHAFQMVTKGCSGKQEDAAASPAIQCLRRTAAFIRGATGEPAQALPWPERLGVPRIQHHFRWPSKQQREVVRRRVYDW